MVFNDRYRYSSGIEIQVDGEWLKLNNNTEVIATGGSAMKIKGEICWEGTTFHSKMVPFDNFDSVRWDGHVVWIPASSLTLK